jgi:hypothetical protein
MFRIFTPVPTNPSPSLRYRTEMFILCFNAIRPSVPRTSADIPSQSILIVYRIVLTFHVKIPTVNTNKQRKLRSPLLLIVSLVRFLRQHTL